MKRCVFIVIIALVLTLASALAENMPIIEWTTAIPEPIMQTGEITDSWKEIITHIDDGTAQQRYAIGATKELDLGDLGTVHMQLAGFDLDERADGLGKAETTWIAMELLPEAKKMNSKGSSFDGWSGSELRAYLQNTVFITIPSAVSLRLVTVRKTQQANGVIQNTDDKIWIPDYEEVFGKESLYFALFGDNNSLRWKTRNGFYNMWWLRSENSKGAFRIVSNGGGDSHASPNSKGGITICFCL